MFTKSTHQDCLKNLRLLAALGEGQYLSTDSSGNIISTVPDIDASILNCAVNTISAFIYRETWETNLLALRKIYTTEIPTILGELSDDELEYEIVNTYDLLKNSRESLNKLKLVFTDANAHANLDSLRGDYLDAQLSHLEEYCEIHEIDIEGAVSTHREDANSKNLESCKVMRNEPIHL